MVELFIAAQERATAAAAKESNMQMNAVARLKAIVCRPAIAALDFKADAGSNQWLVFSQTKSRQIEIFTRFDASPLARSLEMGRQMKIISC